MDAEDIRRLRGSREWKSIRRVILAEEDTCGVCGRPVDVTLGKGFDGSPEVDHIIPMALGGHPIARSNLMLTHRICNRKKGDRIAGLAERKKIAGQVTAERYRGPEEDWSSILGG